MGKTSRPFTGTTDGKVSSPFAPGGTTNDFDLIAVTEFDKFLRELGEWNDRRVAQQVASLVAQEKQTLTIQAEQLSDVKFKSKLKSSQAWVITQHKKIEQLKGFLYWTGGWLSTGLTGSIFYLLSMLVFSALAYCAGINRPPMITCRSFKSDCYLLRLDKNQVILPEQVEQITQEYLKSLNREGKRNSK